MKSKKAGIIGKIIFVSIFLFMFLVVALKYPTEGKIVAAKLYTLFITLVDFLIEVIGWTIKQIAGG